MIYLYRVHFPFCWRVESPIKFSKKGTGSKILEGGCRKRGVTFFQEGGRGQERLQLLHKKINKNMFICHN